MSWQNRFNSILGPGLFGGITADDWLELLRDNFENFEPRLRQYRQYVDALSGYQKNSFAELPAECRDILTREWYTCFDIWGYSAASNQSLK